jgi:hypothetical protein
VSTEPSRPEDCPSIPRLRSELGLFDRIDQSQFPADNFARYCAALAKESKPKNMVNSRQPKRYQGNIGEHLSNWDRLVKELQLSRTRK